MLDSPVPTFYLPLGFQKKAPPLQQFYKLVKKGEKMGGAGGGVGASMLKGHTQFLK